VEYGGSGSAVTAVPNANYSFSQWSDNVTANPRTDTNVTGNNSVTAQFTAGAAVYTLTYTADAGGSITGTSPQTVTAGGSGTAVTAVPASHYHFVKWSDNSTANPRTDTNVAGNMWLTATFAIDSYTVMYDAGVGGYIGGTAIQYINYGADGSAVTAIANTGYHFVKWSDNSTANPRSDTNVTANNSLTATFAVNTYTLAYTATEGGTVSGTLSQSVAHGGNGTAVIAAPSAGYSFTQWSDGLSTLSRTDTNVLSDKNLTAQFSLIGEVINNISNTGSKFVVGSSRGGLVADIPLKLKYTSYTAVAGSEIFTDRTPYSNNAQNYGATAGASELVFDGSNDYVLVPANSSLQVQTNLSMSAWVKPNATYTSDMIIVSPGAYYLVVGSDWSARTYWYGKSAPGYHSSGVNTVTPGQWNLITAVWSASDVKIYVNSVLKNTVASTGVGTTASDLSIGAENASGYRAFKGSIANVKIYNKALTADEVDDIYGQGLEESSFMITGD